MPDKTVTVFALDLELPVIEDAAVNGYIARHIETRLTEAQGRMLARIRAGYAAQGVNTRSAGEVLRVMLDEMIKTFTE